MRGSQHPEDTLNELCRAIAEEIGYGYARLHNYSFADGDDRRMVELLWIGTMTDLLVIYGEEDRNSYPVWNKDEAS